MLRENSDDHRLRVGHALGMELERAEDSLSPKALVAFKRVERRDGLSPALMVSDTLCTAASQGSLTLPLHSEPS